MAILADCDLMAVVWPRTLSQTIPWHCQIFRQMRSSRTWLLCTNSKHIFWRAVLSFLKCFQSTFMSVMCRGKRWMDYRGIAWVTLRWGYLLWINSEILHYFWCENHWSYSNSEGKPFCPPYQSGKSFWREKWHSKCWRNTVSTFFHDSETFSSSTDSQIESYYVIDNENPSPYILHIEDIDSTVYSGGNMCAYANTHTIKI